MSKKQTNNNFSIGYLLVKNDEDKINEIVLKLNQTFNEMLPNQYSLISTESDYEKIELIYQIQMPFLEDKKTKQTFFQQVKKVFIETQEYLPYFCVYEKNKK